MHNLPPFWLKRLNAINWRCFERTSLELHPSTTVLIGENATGKTALLDGIAVALGGLLWELPAVKVTPQESMQRDDVRTSSLLNHGIDELIRHYPATLEAIADAEGGTVGWALSWAGEQKRIEREDHIGKAALQQRWRSSLEEGHAQPLPVLAYYGTSRLWSVKKEKRDTTTHGPSERRQGYMDCLDASSNLKQLTRWMRQQTYADLQAKQQSPLLDAISQAVVRCLGNPIIQFYYDVRGEELRIRFDAGDTFPLARLSDGVRSMVSMVADIAWRAAVLNPFFGGEASRMSPGILLIDELDLHLHPRWQREVLRTLRETFPQMQLIVTTHSPQILASCKREWVRVLDPASSSTSEEQTALGRVPLSLHRINPHIRPLEGYVEGRDSNSILDEVMGAPERPPEFVQKLQRLSALISNQQLEEAELEIQALSTQYGEGAPELVRARWQLEWERNPNA